MFEHLRKLAQATVAELDTLLYPNPPQAEASDEDALGKAVWENLEAFERGEEPPNNLFK
jgi:hypothetical protein